MFFQYQIEMEDLESECTTTESTTSKEGKDGMSSGTGIVQWDDVEKECTDEMETTDMDASMHLLVNDEACLKLRC